MHTNVLQEKIGRIFEQRMSDYIQPTKGRVVHYEKDVNHANVEINNPHGAGTLLLQKVPVQITGGVNVAGPFKGDEVWVNFTGGKLSQPKIVAFGDRQYARTRETRMRHEKQGAYVPDILSKG